MNIYLAVGLAVATFVLAVVLTRRFTQPASFFYVLDRPNDRSLHREPIPRGGGAAILIAILIAAAVVFVINPSESAIFWITLCTSAIALVSFLDDRISVPPAYRFMVHALAAFVLVMAGTIHGEFQSAVTTWRVTGAAMVALAVLYLTWMTNLYNFMDGMDGFAGGMTVCGFTTFAILGFVAGDPTYAMFALAIASAAAGFLVFNFPPARIFMGDAGSASLGFLAGVFSFWGHQRGLLPIWAGPSIFSPFIVDATITLLRRIMEGHKPWHPHKAHYYQRLVQLGWGHRKTVLAEYALMIGAAISTLLAAHASSVLQVFILLLWAFIYLLLARWTAGRERAPRLHSAG